jgi:hypothetical protein
MVSWKHEMIEKLFPKDNRLIDAGIGLIIKFNNMPEKLYKYYTFNDNNKNNLLKSVVWLSKPENFNDPYDCALRCSIFDLLNYFFVENMNKVFENINSSEHELSDEEKVKIINSNNKIATFAEIMIKKDKSIKAKDRNRVKNALIKAEKFILEKQPNSMENIGKIGTIVSCFSEVNDSIVMWSHYANNHKGFCLEYDFKSLGFNDMRTTLLYPVIYQKEILDVTEYLKIDEGHFNNTISILAAITKSKEWKYEKEWRMIIPFGISDEREQLVPLPKNIYAGARISKTNKDFLLEYSKKYNIPFYQSEMKKNMFKIIFKKE